jgi:hypothetical protein
VKGINVCSNKGSGPCQNGDNYKNINMGWGNLKKFFSRITGPEKRLEVLNVRLSTVLAVND